MMRKKKKHMQQMTPVATRRSNKKQKAPLEQGK